MQRIHITWDDNDKTIICWHLRVGWTWQDFHDTLPTAINMIESVDHDVYCVASCTPTDSYLPQNTIVNLTRLVQRWNHRVAMAVIVGDNNLVRYVIRALFEMYPKARTLYRVTDSVAEARALIDLHKRTTNDVNNNDTP